VGFQKSSVGAGRGRDVGVNYPSGSRGCGNQVVEGRGLLFLPEGRGNL